MGCIKEIPTEVLVSALKMYCIEKYSSYKISKILGYERRVLMRHLEKKLNIKMDIRPKNSTKQWDIPIGKIIKKDEREMKNERIDIMTKLVKMIKLYEENIEFNVYELENQDKNKYSNLGTYRLRKKYNDHMLLIKEVNGVERRLSIAYRDILTKDIKLYLVKEE